jgi:hypothetical protein
VYNQRFQKGMTMWGMIFVLSVLAFVVFISFKLFTPYKDDFKVRAALDSLARQPDVDTLGKEDIINALAKRFDIDDIEHVKAGQDVKIETRGRMKIIRIQYEPEIALFGNVYLLLKFNHEKQVRSGE